MKFQTEKLILEGPDLSGKTSLYSSIHNLTEYKWNIQDRSSLSMVCYARQYGRDSSSLRRCLYKELTNLNNRIVVLLPPLNVLLERHDLRGDNLQTRKSLRTLYKIFEEEVSKIKNLPNVLVVTDSNTHQKVIGDNVVQWLKSIESLRISEVGSRFIKPFVKNHEEDEHVLCFEYSDTLKKNYENDILDDKKEGRYYREIEKDFDNIIQKELLGLNEYETCQDMSSRRFYYSSRSCISSLHFKPRGKTLEFLCCFRSTDAEENSDIDVKFLEYLVQRMGNKYFSNCVDYRICLTMNSAHLRR